MMQQKYIFYFILSISAFFTISCNEQKAQQTDIYVFIDVTDTLSRNADIPTYDLVKRIGVDTASGGLHGGTIKFFMINDISQGKVLGKIELPVGNGGLLGDNPLARADVVKTFWHSLKTTIAEVKQKATYGANRSKIYQNMCEELNNLAQSKADKKLAIVYSDLLENSDAISFYGAGVQKIAAWEKDIKAADAFLKKSYGCSLPDLSAIELHIVQVRSTKNDAAITAAKSFWKLLFNYKKANVKFEAELNLLN